MYEWEYQKGHALDFLFSLVAYPGTTIFVYGILPLTTEEHGPPWLVKLHYTTSPQLSATHTVLRRQQSQKSRIMAEQRLKTSIAILGCGEVGATLAYTLLQNPICSEVILVDPKKELLEAQVRDLGDATYGGRAATKIRAGTHKEAGEADIVVVTAGAKQKPGKLSRYMSPATISKDGGSSL